MITPDKQTLINFFQTIYPSPDAVAKEIVDKFHFVQLKKGEFFLEEGKRSNEYLFLEKGIMRSYLFDTDSNEVTTNFYSSGNVVFESASFFQHIPSQENIQALTNCTGWKISFEELNALFHNLPAFRETGRAVLVKTLVALKCEHSR